MDDELTVFCPFTRLWAVPPFFEALSESDVPFDQAAFVAYIDSDDPALEDAVRNSARALAFASVDVHVSGLPTPTDSLGPRRRRVRHAMMREASKPLVGDGQLLLLEDDTLIPPDTYARLSETLTQCDWAIGAEVGRWGHLRPPGVWRMVYCDGVLSRKETVMPGPEAVVSVDACGFYCVLTSGAVYRELDCTTWSDIIGLDVHTTWRLTQAGRRLMVDWRVPCVHMTTSARLTIADAQSMSLPLTGWETTGTRMIATTQGQRRPTHA